MTIYRKNGKMEAKMEKYISNKHIYKPMVKVCEQAHSHEKHNWSIGSQIASELNQQLCKGVSTNRVPFHLEATFAQGRNMKTWQSVFVHVYRKPNVLPMIGPDVNNT